MEHEYKNHHIESIPIASTPTCRKKTTGSRTPRRARAHLQEDIPWTAARCQRLLRTISSRIQILRRLSENDFAEQFLRTPKAKRKRDVSVDPVEKLGSRLAALQTPSRGDDPEWFPSTQKKCAGRTYGGRGRGKKAQATAQDEESKGELGFRTPYIRRLLRADAMLSPESPADPYSTSGRLAQISRKGQQDAIQPKTHAERALKTLLDSFDNLLASTNPELPERRRGASSLRSMCLRKIPEYIDYEQRWAEEEEDDYVFDATETIYVALENLGCGSWSSLRELVRAHAVKMIIDAMHERMWPLTSFDRLMDICTKHNAITESHRLLRTWLQCSKGRIEEPEKCFVHHAAKSGSTGFMYRTLADSLTTLDDDRFNAAVLQSLWTELPTALARRSFFVDAAAFVRKFALDFCLARTSNDRLSAQRRMNLETLSDLISIITTMALRNGFTQDGSTDQPNIMADNLHWLAFEIAQSALAHNEVAEGCCGALEVANCFLSSSLMVHAALGTYDQVQDRMEFNVLYDLVHQHDSKAGRSQSSGRSSINSTRATAMCRVARHATGWDISVSQHDVLRQTVSGLLLAQSQASSKHNSVLKSLAIEIAAIWAQSQGDNASYLFAEEVQRLVLSDAPRNSSLSSSESDEEINGYKWEEAIGEWVATTPLPLIADEGEAREASVSSRDSGIGMSESDTPSKNPTTATMDPKERADSQEIDVQMSPALPLCRRLRPDERDELASSPCKPMPDVPMADPERDELASSPLKSMGSTTLAADITHQMQVTPIHANEMDQSGNKDNLEGIPLRLQDRDELAMTPHVARKASAKGRRSRTRTVQATPARMTLRSQRKPSRPRYAEDGLEGHSDDELGV